MSGKKQNEVGLYPTIITAGLVSNGKSTLLNAMLGYNLMPTNNLACTAMAVSIVDTLGKDYEDAKYFVGESAISISRSEVVEQLPKINKANSSGRFVLYERMKGIDRGNTPFVIIDTPGINDAVTPKHADITLNCIKEIKMPVLLYVAHVKSCGTDDEKRFLMKLAEVYRQQISPLRWVIAINGSDMIDIEKTGYDSYVDIELEMAQMCGLPRPEVFVVSALGASLCRRVLAGEQINKREQIDFDSMLALFSARKSVQRAKREGRKISKQAIKKTLHDTGVPALEKYLHTMLNN